MFTFIFIVDVEFLREKDGELTSFLLFMSYGPSLLVMTYIFSFYFKSETKGQTFIFLFVFFGSFLLSIASFVLRLVKSTRDVFNDHLVWIFRLFPFYNFTVSFINMGNTNLFKIFFKWDSEPDYLTTKVCLIELVMLWVLFIVMLLLLILIENWMNVKKLFKKKKTRQSENNFADASKEIRQDINERIKNGTFGPKDVSLTIFI